MIKGFIDLQVNGYAGIDFNQNDLNAEDLHKACTKLKEDGVKGILATIITASIDEMTMRLRRIVKLREQDPLVKEIILGLHIEGPFVSKIPGYGGAHPDEFICPSSVDKMQLLLEAADGLARIVTLAHLELGTEDGDGILRAVIVALVVLGHIAVGVYLADAIRFDRVD